MNATTYVPVQRHRFSRAVLAQVFERFETDNWHGLLEVLEHWSVIVAAAALSVFAWNTFGIAAALPLYLFAIFLIGGRQRALAGVLHQAAHGALLRNRFANRVVGTLLGGYSVLQSFTGYRSSHVLNHHRFLGNPDRDPDYRQYIRCGLCGPRMSRAAIRRYLLTLLGPRATLVYVGYLLRHRVLNPEERPLESVARLVYLASLLALAWRLDAMPLVLMYWIVPLITTQVWIGAIAELVEHYPLIETAERVDIAVTRNRDCGPLASFLLGEHPGEGYHLVHHLFPRTPFWRLKEVHGLLLQDPTYAALDMPTSWRHVMRSIFAPLPARAGMQP